MCGCGGIGRRVRFRSVWGKPHEGSSPFTRTIQILRSGERSIELTLKSPLIPHRAPSQRGRSCQGTLTLKPLTFAAPAMGKAYRRSHVRSTLRPHFTRIKAKPLRGRFASLDARRTDDRASLSSESHPSWAPGCRSVASRDANA